MAVLEIRFRVWASGKWSKIDPATIEGAYTLVRLF